MTGPAEAPLKAVVPVAGPVERPLGDDDGRPYRLAGYSALGVGLGAFAVAGVFGARVASEEKARDRADSLAAFKRHVHSASDATRWVNVGLVAGGVSVVAGGVLLYLGYGTRTPGTSAGVTVGSEGVVWTF